MRLLYIKFKAFEAFVVSGIRVTVNKLLLVTRKFIIYSKYTHRFI